MMRHTRPAIDRREALRRAALLLGGMLSTPTIAGVLAGCESPRADANTRTSRALTNDQLELVATMAEHILPETDTPGARAAGVHHFIDTMLSEYYPGKEKQLFIDGLADVDARSMRSTGQVFVRSSPTQQRDLLDALDAAPTPFFRMLKELTVVGYYTSQVGATQELKYARVPGRFEGCVPFTTVGRTWSV